MENYDITKQVIINRFERNKIGFDEKFSFHCTQCGACCINRDDIILSPQDVFNLSKELGMDQAEFMRKYCDTYVGHDSRMVVVCLQSVGKDNRCPLLEGRRCSVHSVKPSICALFPLGRGMCYENEQASEMLGFSYFLPPYICGDHSEEFTVREWLARFGMQPEDEYSSKWMLFLPHLSQFLREAEKRCTQETMERLRLYSFTILYFGYNPEKDFLPQFQQRLDILNDFIINSSIDKL